MTFSIVIPTKNRPKELLNSFKAILKQTRLPDQLIIVDQSIPSNVVEKKILSAADKVNLLVNYIHNQEIDGLVEAKNFGVSLNNCDYISFFDDDILLEKEYFEFIEDALISNPLIIGANGIITNYPKIDYFPKLIFRLTHFGIFKDDRVKKYSNLIFDKKVPERTNVLSGGLSTWKKEVFEKVSFDIENKFHSYEDIEFSIRVEKKFPRRMFIIPKARLTHNHASMNRQSLLLRTEKDVVEIWMLFKKNKNIYFFGLDFFVLMLGLFFKSIVLSLKHKNFDFVRSFLRGFKVGFQKKIVFDEF